MSTNTLQEKFTAALNVFQTACRLSLGEDSLKLLDEAETGLRDLKKDLSDRVIPIRRLRNGRLHINKLPSTILCKIIFQTEDPRESDNYRARCRLSTVCRHWHDVITGHPGFWDLLHVRYVDSLKRVMERNVGSLFSVRCGSQSEYSIRRFFETISPVSRRWKALAFAGPLDRTKRLLELPTDNLRALNVNCTGSPKSDKPIELFPGCSFLEVDVRSTWLNWSSPRFSGLRRLALERCAVNARPSISQIYTILSSSPALEFLCFRDWSEPSNDDEVDRIIDPVLEPVILNRLLVLDLHKIPERIARWAIGNIVAPNLECLWTYKYYVSWTCIKWHEPTMQICLNLLSRAPVVSLKYVVGGASLLLKVSEEALWDDEWVGDKRVRHGIRLAVDTKEAPDSWWSEMTKHLASIVSNKSVLLQIDIPDNPQLCHGGEIRPSIQEVISGYFPFATCLSFPEITDIPTYLGYLSSLDRRQFPRLTSISIHKIENVCKCCLEEIIAWMKKSTSVVNTNQIDPEDAEGLAKIKTIYADNRAAVALGKMEVGSFGIEVLQGWPYKELGYK